MGRSKRSEHAERYVRLPHYIMNTMAWSRLSATARAAWLEFVRLHNGSNNGRIAMPSRTLGKRLGVHKTTAETAIKDLITFGFMTCTRGASFFGKRRATEYLMTPIPDDRTEPKGLPSRAFQNIGKIGNGLDGDGPPNLQNTAGERTQKCGREASL